MNTHLVRSMPRTPRRGPAAAPRRRSAGLSTWPKRVVSGAVAAGALLGAGRAHANEKCADDIITNTAASFQQQSSTVGFAVGIITSCGVETLRFFGKANLSTLKDVDANTLFHIASTTKNFTATLVAGYATGSISNPYVFVTPDSPINSYVPAPYRLASSDVKSTITLRQIINYQSGLPRDDGADDPEDIFEDYDSTSLLFTPGTQSAYSNFGFFLMGRALEYSLQSPWETQLHTKLISPLGMNDTQFYKDGDGNVLLSSSQLSRLALGYDCSSLPCSAHSLDDSAGELAQGPAGGLCSTPHDMMRWLRVHLGFDDTVPQAQSQAILASHNGLGGWASLAGTCNVGTCSGGSNAGNQCTDNWQCPDSTCNLVSRVCGGPFAQPNTACTSDADCPGPTGWFEKAGVLPGFRTYVTFNPQEKLGVFVMANSDQFDDVRLATLLVQQILQSPCMPQVFNPGMLGCPGTVAWQNRDTLCPTGYSACSAHEWTGYPQAWGTSPPKHAYWTSDDLKWGGGAHDSCSASTTTGTECWSSFGTIHSPMRVCPETSPDPENNRCNVTGCALDASGHGTFGGCSENPTAGTLCCRRETACSSTAGSRQIFGPGVEGCGGVVSWENRNSLCAPGCSACGSEQWDRLNMGIVPSAHYWTDDDLKWGGTVAACWATPFASSDTHECPAGWPMRVCAAQHTDGFGNTCTWINCGSRGSDFIVPGHYGGCSHDPTAGTLCCCNESSP